MYYMPASEFLHDVEEYGVSVEFRDKLMTWDEVKAELRGGVKPGERIYIPALLAETSASAIVEAINEMEVTKCLRV